MIANDVQDLARRNNSDRCAQVPLVRHRLLPERTILCSERFQFLLVPAHGAAIHRNTGPRSKCGAALTISYNRISERLESAKRLHRYLNFADDGNHARLDTSIARFVGFLRLGYFTIGSNPPRWSGSRPSRLLRQFEAADIAVSLQFRSIHLFFSPDENPRTLTLWNFSNSCVTVH